MSSSTNVLGDDPGAVAYNVFALVVNILQAAVVTIPFPVGMLLFVLWYRKHDKDDASLPPLSVIMPCYLPNERFIIGENIKLLCDSPQFTKVILVYNTPPGDTLKAEEDELKAMELYTPTLKVLKVETSRSKAENLNAAVDEVRTPYCMILDADHRIDEESIFELRRQLHAQKETTVCAQGAVLLRGSTIWARLIHGLSWQFFCFLFPATQMLFGSVVFCGGGALWRTYALQELRFDHTSIAEDDDISMRAFRKNYVMISAPLAYIHELAPAGVSAFIAQRLRWCIGFEMSANKHLPYFICRKPQRLHLRLFAYTSYVILVACVTMGVWNIMRQILGSAASGAPELVTVQIFLGIVPPALTVVSILLTIFCFRRMPKWPGYCALSLPLTMVYGALQVGLFVYSRFRICCGSFEWVATERRISRRNSRASAAAPDRTTPAAEGATERHGCERFSYLTPEASFSGHFKTGRPRKEMFADGQSVYDSAMKAEQAVVTPTRAASDAV